MSEVENQVNDVIIRFQSKDFFRSYWDIGSMAVFFIFIGMILMLVTLVLLRCCCSCCCCSEDEKPHRRKVGIVNMALQP